MNYTIIDAENPQDGSHVSMNKDGNRFYVAYGDTNGHACSRTFDKFEEAFAVFSKFAEIVARGDWSSEDRCEMMRAA